jgi:membrane protease YdiL (CAAX protease family)
MPDDRPEIELRGKGEGPMIRKTFILRSATVLYSLMAAFSFAWALIRGDLDLLHHPRPVFNLPWHADLWGGIAAGVLFGYLVAFLSRAMSARAEWARELLVEMKSILGTLDWKDSLYLAALSALCEEIFFRGVLQPHLWLVWSSVIFGVAHVPRSRTFILWTLEALLLGFCLGLLFVVTGNLAAPVAAHFTINFRNLLYIRRVKLEP